MVVHKISCANPYTPPLILTSSCCPALIYIKSVPEFPELSDIDPNREKGLDTPTDH